MFTHTEDRETVYAWFTFAHWLVYANSAANPIIYNFLSGEFSPVSSLQTTAQGKGWMTRSVNTLELQEGLSCNVMRIFFFFFFLADLTGL